MESKLIRNRDRAKQILAFDGMQYGKCRPTDLDMSIDFQGKTFIFGELKGAETPLTLGQKIHLTGLVDAIKAGGKTAYAFLAHHNIEDTEHDVHVGEAIVAKLYDGHSWQVFYPRTTVDALVQDIYNSHLLENMK